MKYCKKCGMLLEDNMDICIGCGNDVKAKGSYSKYPVELQQKIDLEKKEQGKQSLAIVAIVLVFVAILLMIGIFVSQMHVNISSQGGGDGSGKSFFAQRLMDSMNNNQNNGPSKKKRTVKDDAGSYYKQITVKDDAGHDVFYAVYPEDLNKIEHNFDYERGSQRYPVIFSFVATNDDNTTQLTFTSPQHYQYISMQGGEMNASDVQKALDGAVSFYNFTSVETYLKEIIKQSYPTSKKIEELGSTDLPGPVNDSFDKLVEHYEENAEDTLADLFTLPKSTVFTHNNTYKSNKLMDYRILTKEDHAVTCRFYVPVFCEVYDYKDDDTGLSGQVLDCYILTVSSFEAGSDELYDWYENAFDMFVDNFRLCDDFLKFNEAYAKDISEAVKKGEHPKKNGADGAEDIYKKAGSTGTFNTMIEEFMDSHSGEGTRFVADEYSLNVPEDIKQVFLDPAKDLIYVSPDEEDYPGDEFLEFKVAE